MTDRAVHRVLTLKGGSGGLADRLVAAAAQAVETMTSGGAMPPGRNGAYGDPETPIRNTSHWLISFCFAWRLTGEPKFRDSAEKALSYLLSILAQTPGGLLMRHAGKKDRTNGVLGQAFVIEALYYASITFDDSKAHDAAVSLAKLHQFDPKRGVWRRTSPSGTEMSPDGTFNHQLYFAAAVGLVAGYDSGLRSCVDRFLAGLSHNLRVRSDGRIVHQLPRPQGNVRGFVDQLGMRRPDSNLLRKEADYHLYNMYAFSVLHEYGSDVPSKNREAWNKAAKFVCGAEVRARLESHFWADGLRSGMETIACDLYLYSARLENAPSEIERVTEFYDYTAGPDRSFSVVSPDPVTQRARSYRYWRIFEVIPQSSVVSK
jgi:hypothetical protein